MRACRHAAARAAGGRTEEFRERRYPGTFHTAALTDGADRHMMLWHAHLPLVAFTDGQQACCAYEFLDPPGWAHVCTDAGFELLSARELNGPASAADVAAMPDAERKLVTYWRPGTVGQLLFNVWD